MLEFEPRGNLLEKLDPRAKMLIVCLLSAGAILTDSWLTLSLLLFFTLLLWKLAGLSLRNQRLIAGMVALCAIGCVLTQSIFYGAFWGDEPQTVLVELTPVSTPVIGRLAVTLDGIEWGGMIALRLAIIILSAVLLPLTTHPAALTLSLVRLRIPFFIVIILSLGFRFIPIIQRNLIQLMDVQKLRGIKPLSPKGLSTSLNALLNTTLRIADELALSLETRAFYPSASRTFYRDIRFTLQDAGAICFSIGLFIAILLFEPR